MHRVALVLGDDVSTDVIYPGRFMATVLPAETGQYAFADLADFNAQLKAGAVPRGSVVVAGRNFGCGSSREQAASCLAAHGLTIVARGFARIFLQNAINVGLRVVEAAEVEASVGDEMVIVPGEVVDARSGRSFPLRPLPAARQQILEAGGLIPYTRRRLLEQAPAS